MDLTLNAMLQALIMITMEIRILFGHLKMILVVLEKSF